MKSPTSNLSKPLFRRSVLSTLIALTAISASAQEATQDTNLEEVVVTAQFQRNLENALDVKRNASTIVDGISADDIGTLPALDMGEALQAVAGVQLNREGERRESSINLRGLPSGFVLTTANGQTFSNPTRSDKVFGAPNPFGAYDPAVFNGIDVIKTQTAAMQEGGIAGTVDQKLAKALDKKDGLAISVGARSEELADALDKEFVISGSKHLIEDTLAITATLATSDQTFRRDTIKINRYDNLPTNGNFVGADGEDYATWAAANNLPANAVVKMPGELRQGSEINSGSRTSFSGGIEFQATDELKLGLNTVYTSRDMDDNGQQELDIRPRQSGVKVTPLTAPFATGAVDSNDNPLYSVSDIRTTNSSYAYTSRVFDILEESQAVLLDAEWTNDVWTLDGVATFSSSTNELNEILISPRFDRLASGDNGIVNIFRTGQGNIGDFETTFENFDNLDLDQPWNVLDTVSGAGTVTQVNQGRLNTLITGSWEKIDRNVTSFEANALRVLDSGPLESVQFGFRQSQEEQNSDRLRSSPTGLVLDGVLTNDRRIDPAYASESAFFGGEAPGFAGAGEGWYAFDVNALTRDLAATIGTVNPASTGEEPVRVPHSNLIARGGQQSAGLIYDTTLDTSALYAMANLSFDAFNRPVTGNVGVRYVSSTQEASAPFYAFGITDINNPETKTVESDYSFALPSLNFAMDLSDELKLRVGYGESISRPNIRAATPSTRVDAGREGEVNIVLPGANVKPFSAKSYDMSLEWYNREGSAVTLAVFKKDINDFFQTASFCSDQLLAEYGIDVGDITQGSDDSCTTNGADAYDSADANYILAGDQVNISQIRNSDAQISVQGYELSVQQNLNFLPYPWNGLGGVINYSSTSQDSPLEARIPGISDDTYNVIAYYEQGPFGIRFAYNYRTEYELESVGTFNGEGNKNVKAAGRIDMSAYYNVTEDLTLSFKGYNLTEALYEEYQDTERQPRANHFDGRVFVMQAKYTF
ncbi:TonB-dependent receptor [Saccharophagus degradans]|uniref:TonB-dependent receptor n=1 Tax=Saccharophagus degradans TaxID=86304 RepID=UPI002477CD7C|nr:TonB-dependent receptor [Saccharophagus degradans]WGO97265.1 TonB-dependent receptor [Saccharophagus degradans]